MISLALFLQLLSCDPADDSSRGARLDTRVRRPDASASLVASGPEVEEEFVYGASGDLSEIRSREAPVPLAISDFSPKEGEIGDFVSVVGTGFDPTAAHDVIALGGAQAQVLAATPTQLVFAVPPSAVSGLITVSRGAESATSSSEFTVTQQRMVTIADFTPKIGKPGTEVVIFGSNFTADPAANAVTFGGGDAAILSASTETMTAVVGPASRSGKIGVVTGGAQAVSATDFVVVPGAMAVSEVGYTDRLAAGGSSVVSVDAPGKAVLLLFDGVEEQGYTLPVTSVTIPGWTKITVYDPLGATLATTFVTVGQSSKIEVPPLKLPGTYTVAIQPPTTSVGALTMRLYQDVTVSLDATGSAASLVLAEGQNGRCIFVGRPGEFPVVGFPALSVTPAGKAVTVGLSDVLGATLGWTYVAGPGSWQMPELASPGPHTITVRPQGTAAASMSVLLSLPTAERIVDDGSPVRFQTARAGQAGRYTFEGVIGGRYTAYASGITFPTGVDLYVYRPNGAQHASRYSAAGELKLDVPALPISGTYTLVVASRGIDIGAADIRLHRYVQEPLVVDGPEQPIEIGIGQNGKYTFSAEVGEFVGVGITAYTLTSSGAYVSIVVERPDKTTLTYVAASSRTSFQLPQLPASGEYTIAISPPGVAGASLAAIASRALTGTISPDGVPVRVESARIGQALRYTFTAVAGQCRTLVATIEGGFAGWLDLTVAQPSGAQVAYGVVTPASALKLDLSTLPVSGTYVVTATPRGPFAGAVSLRLQEQVTGELVLDDAQRTLSLGPGLSGRYLFDGHAGDYVGVGFPSLTLTPSGGAVALTVSRPDGATLGTTRAGGPGSWQLPRLPVDGTYVLTVKPETAASFSMSVLLSRALGGTVEAGGVATRFESARVGQAGRYSFSANNGQSFTLVASGGASLATSPTVAVYQPSGALVTSANIGAGSSSKLDLPVLPATGTYWATVVPSATGTGSVDLLLQEQPTDGLDVGDPPKTLSLATGQNGRYTVSGVQGELRNLTFRRVTSDPAGSDVDLHLFRPDGARIWSGTGSSAPITWQLPTLPATGTYTVVVSPRNTAAATFELGIAPR